MTALTRPPQLWRGARVRVVAPAGPIPAGLLDAGLAELGGWGVRVTVAEHVLGTHPTLPYLAGTDADRAADLRDAWCDPNVDAVFCARGGYGCLRVLDLLDWPAMAAATPKLFVGSSDVTALHQAFAARLGVTTVFGPMIATHAFAHDPVARAGLRDCLFNPTTPPVVTGEGPLAAGVTGGRGRGVLVGGNASLLAATLGAPHSLPPPGAIVLLEDVTESPYRIDRIISQLGRAGWFERAAGVALGSWVDCGDLGELRAMFTDRLAGLGIPVGWGFGFGHGPGQSTVPLGVAAELDADTGTLTVLEPALRSVPLARCQEPVEFGQ